MSGICGLVNLDNAPVGRDEIEELTTHIDYRGPDRHQVWIRDAVGLGHTLLCTTFGAEDESQPMSLDGEVWITADARIDGQSELKSKLKASGRELPAGVLDSALILHAYDEWGQDCTRHLIGDFAFAIWDGRRRHLFCARDHLGIKPFFYAVVGRRLVFSNTLDCVRRHPAVRSTLNELAIADFLLFESRQDPAMTAFADVQRLPAAHCLVLTAAGLETRAYWSLPYGATVRYRDARAQVECFQELLNVAVAERIRTDRVSFKMSGGIDSTAIAAVATRVPRGGRVPQVRAYTAVYDRLIRDEERYFSGLAAEKLGIPIEYRVADAYGLYARYSELGPHHPEPVHDPFAAITVDLAKDASSHGRVALTGWDGDALLSESPRAYFAYLLGKGSFARLLPGALRYALAERKMWPANGWASLASPSRNIQAPEPFPSWVNPDFERRLRLRERFAQARSDAPPLHPIRPGAFRTLEFLMGRSTLFDGLDPGRTRSHVEYRHPLLDLRLLEYCLSLPPHPWCVRKEILRQSMRGMLPEPVRARPKQGLGGYPHHELLRREDAHWVDEFIASPETSCFIDRDKIAPASGEIDPHRAWANLRPLSLELWLRNVDAAQTP